jgi:hypothetical protein
VEPGEIEEGVLMLLITQPQLIATPLVEADVIYTPGWVARDMVEFFRPKGRILEPCKGDGVFLRYLPEHVQWCEIQEGKDFFTWADSVDWIIGNPPYKVFSEWMYHSMRLALNICYLIPCNKAFNSFKMLRAMKEWGRIKCMRVYGGGAALDFPIGFAIGALHFQRGYHGPMEISYYEGQRD